MAILANRERPAWNSFSCPLSTYSKSCARGMELKAETKMGARAQLYASVADVLTKQGELITGDITRVSSTDVAELAMNLMEQQTLYNLALSLGARVIPQSLADYL